MWWVTQNSSAVLFKRVIAKANSERIDSIDEKLIRVSLGTLVVSVQSSLPVFQPLYEVDGTPTGATKVMAKHLDSLFAANSTLDEQGNTSTISVPNNFVRGKVPPNSSALNTTFFGHP